MLKQSEKDIVTRVDVSVSKIDRKLNEISSHTVLRHEHLPIHMNWDEFKATKDATGKMAFIEGKNNLIKSIKHIAFGYRKYDNFIARIFLISDIIKE